MILSIECRFAECHDYTNAILSIFMLNIVMLCRDYVNVMLSVFMLNVVMLNVVAPKNSPSSVRIRQNKVTLIFNLV